MQMRFDTDGVSNMLRPGVWGGGGGGVAYAAAAASPASSAGAKELLNDVAEFAESIADAAMFVYNAYNENYLRQIEIETKITTEQINIVTLFLESDTYDEVRSLGRMAMGVKDIIKGIGLIFVPVPTTAEDLTGVSKITFGVVKVAWGLAEYIGEIIK